MDDQPLTEQQLQALLRLKRHEQPPPGYFDDLLTNIHRRQREEMLRRPAWRIFAGRVRAFFSSLDWNYAATMGAILLLGIGAIRLALPNQQGHRGLTQQSVPASAPNSGNVVNVPLVGEPMITLQPGRPPLMIMKAPRAMQPDPQGPTRFVIEAQPASYAPSPIHL